MEKRGGGFSFLCTLASTGRNVLQKPGLEILLEGAVFPGMLIRKLSKVELTPFPLEGPGVAVDWVPPAPCMPGSCGPLLLGSPCAWVLRPGCPGPSLPVNRLMQELGMSTHCPQVGAVPAGALLPSHLTFGILGSSEMVLLGAGPGVCPCTALFSGASQRPAEVRDKANLRGGACFLSPVNWGLSLSFKPGLLTSGVF